MTGESRPPDGTRSGHRLEPLFNPRSVAVIGASGREGRPGNQAIRGLGAIGYRGRLYPVTPSYQEIESHRCYPDIASVPERVDLAVVAGATERIEAQLRAAIEARARAALIFANALVKDDAEPPILERVAAMAREAGIALLGPNSIGYVNWEARTAATWVPPTSDQHGPIAAVIQSGSNYGYAYIVDPRLKFALAVHPGQEATLTAADVMDYALELGSTRVLALYLEVVRDPERFIAALAKANARDVPVVVLRPGRTERGREHLLSHSGRLAGSDGAFEAVFRRHGVLRASTMDEWWSTVLLMAHPRRPGPGGVAAIMDSGGQRSLLADDAEELGVPWARIGAETKRLLAGRLSYGLPAINPVDAWGAEPDWPDVFRDCFSAVVNDPDTAIGMLITDIGAGDSFSEKLAVVCKDVAAATTKPVIAGTYTSRQFYPRYINELSESGIPVLDGGRSSLLAIRHALAYRDHRARAAEPPPPAPDRATVERWRRRLSAVAALDESESLAMLEDFGIPVAASRSAASLDESLAAAAALGYPVALKTAAGMAHKSDQDGVRLGLGDERALAAAYRELAGRLGPRVLVAALASPGVEVALGVVRDQEFGPIVMVGAGGVLVELLAEVRFALAPVGEGEVLRMIGQLRLGRLLEGVRGRRPANVEALCRMVSRLSSMAAALGESVAEIDVNPVLVGPERVVAVDALVRTSDRVEVGRRVGEGAVLSS